MRNLVNYSRPVKITFNKWEELIDSLPGTSSTAGQMNRLDRTLFKPCYLYVHVNDEPGNSVALT